jgi:phenylacetate-CoA ligase
MATAPPEAANSFSVIVPCFNEEFNLPELAERTLRTFERGGLDGELILVDDGSDDGTARVIRGLMKQHPGRVVGQFHGKNRGITGAWRTGVGVARGKHVAVIDADLQYQPEDVLRLYRALIDSSVDIVQGFRSPVGRERGARYTMSRAFNTMLNGVFAMSLRDNKSGFVCTSREVLADLLTYAGSYSYWQSFIMVAAHAKGYSYREVEVLFESRKQGESFLEKTAYRAAARSLIDIGKATWEYRLKARPHNMYDHFLEKRPLATLEAPDPPSPRAHPERWALYMASFNATHWMITRDVERYYEALNRTQWLSPADVRELQNEKLARLIRHAYRNVPYYRAVMQEAKLRPEDIRGQDDLHKLPFLTKTDLRQHLYFDIMSNNHDKDQVLRVSTSGSTGEPLVCFADRSQLEFRWAATLRSQEWTGYRFGDPTVRLWHQTIGMNRAQATKERADAVLANRTYVPIFEMSDERLEEMMTLIAGKQPVLIDGYAEAFDFLAQYVQARGGLSFAPRAIMSSAQTLPDRSRQIIEKAFGCKVFDKYGSREFSGIAYESDGHDGHLVVAEGYIVEILVDGRPALPGETGEIVITDLNNYCMPFIRYRIGDLGEAMDNSLPARCGRGLPRIGAIQGRVQSIIQGTDGRYVPGTFFAHTLKDFEFAIRRYQVVQEEPGAIRFLVVKGGRYSDDVMEEIKALIRNHLGSGLVIDVEFVENIEMVRTGKRLASVSKIPIDFQRKRFVRAVSGS